MLIKKPPPEQVRGDMPKKNALDPIAFGSRMTRLPFIAHGSLLMPQRAVGPTSYHQPLITIFPPMDYEYSVIGSIICDAETIPASGTTFTYNNYVFDIRKTGNSVGIRLRDSSADTSVSKNTSEEDVTEVCKQLSEKFGCKVSMRKGYEVYGNANVFNGGSDYEVIEEKWFNVEFDKGVRLL